MKAELSLFGFLVTPRNYYTGVSETAQSTFDCSRFAPGRDARQGNPPSFETRGTLGFPAGSGRVGGKEGGWDPRSGSVMLLRGRRPIGGVSELHLGYPNLGSDFGTGI